MHVLYYSPGAASFVIHWLLIEMQLPHQLQKLDLAAGEQRRPEYLKLNPAGVVPTLLVEGRAHCETVAIVLQLIDSHPEHRLAPAVGTPERARYYETLLRCANGLQPAFRRWFYPDVVNDPADTAALRAGVQAQLEAQFARFDTDFSDGRPYLLGEHVSGADFMLAMMMRWSRNMPKPATSWPHLAAFAARMKARPSFKALNESEGLTEWL
jgi:glutathione S-transferase